MSWGNISDQKIQTILSAINAGRINPNIKTFIFRIEESQRLVGIDAETEEEAKRYAAYQKNYSLLYLERVDPMTFNGLTIEEIMEEAKKRGIL